MKILKKISGKFQFIFIQVFIRPFSLFIQIFDQNLFDVYRNFFRVRVFDCFIFHNELDILKLRIDYLKDTVDFFVIVESKLTFTNKEKEKYNAFEYINKLPYNLRKKIRYVQLNPQHFPEEIKNDPWEMEYFVRNAISFALNDISYFDFLWISDVDEIPNKNNIFKLGRLSMFFAYYKMNLLKKFSWQNYAKAILGKHIKHNKPQFLRWNKWRFGFKVKNGGWHFSFLMNPNMIREKVKSYAHSECNKDEFISLENIKKSIKNKKDLFGKTNEDLYLEKDLSFLPEIVLENLNYYKKFIEF